MEPMSSLTRYRAKRTFQKTPEPKGTRAPAQGPLQFVVHKHEARRLHYDLRLEHRGVLLSWAVPKGPSLNPREKRLAIQVEDHPLEYASFEGVIPEGNYGAGPVMIWDQGTYTCSGIRTRQESENKMSEALKKGEILLVFNGEKLHGEFALVRMEKAGKNAWLLVKKHDRFEEISGKAEMPRGLKPMLATLVKEPFDRPGWIFEMKWDGYRALAEIENGKIRLRSRKGLSLNEQYPAIVESLSALKRRAILDGEIVVLNKNGVSEFQLLQNYGRSGKGNLFYYAFDLLYLDGKDLQNLPLLERKALLKNLIVDLDRVRISEHIEERGTAFYEEASKMGLEGMVAKDGQSPYRAGMRTRSWLKVKARLEQEAVVAGFTEPRGSRKRFGALVLGVHRDGSLRYAGHVGTGFSAQTLELVHRKLSGLRQEKSPFQDVPRNLGAIHWVKPELVCQVAFHGWTRDGIMRQPAFLGLREDKPAREVVMEIPEEPPESRVPVKHRSTRLKKIPVKTVQAERDLTVGKQKLRLTNLHKIFWPEEGYTKQDLIRYYEDLASTILPYLRGRPQTLRRFPDGMGGESFYQKNVGDLPKGVESITVKGVTYVVCQNKATLLYLANLACIDLNPWNSRVAHLEEPDYLVIDLDPGNIAFEEVIRTARAVREILDECGAENFCKTSGATGLHIYVPLGARYAYKDARKFTEIVCTLAHERLPRITSLERQPERRRGKIYLDYLQNSRGQTVAAPYCVRPLPGAPVSTPLDWEEVKKGLRPSDFNLRTIHTRLEKVGDLWKPVLGAGARLDACLERLEKDALARPSR